MIAIHSFNTHPVFSLFIPFDLQTDVFIWEGVAVRTKKRERVVHNLKTQYHQIVMGFADGRDDLKQKGLEDVKCTSCQRI